jgi:hypothetical protein
MVEHSQMNEVISELVSKKLYHLKEVQRLDALIDAILGKTPREPNPVTSVPLEASIAASSR